MESQNKIKDFTLPSTSGEPVSLHDKLKHVRGIVITSFPLAFTGN